MTRPTVLIVDDHEGFRAAARRLLTDAGFDVVGEAQDGHGGIVRAAELRPTIVVLDVRLPDIGGFDVSRRLLAGLHSPAVVLVSTREAADYGREIRASGASGFITKSRLSGDTLRAALERQVEETP